MTEIKIADTGKGISDVEKEKIFDKFYSGEHKIADNRRSLGLGLYLCKAIVEAHGGSIHVTDNLPHGSVFRFTLPLEEVIIHEEISHNPDIILLDLGLPDIDGVEVIRRVRSWSNVPIIVISARAEDNDKLMHWMPVQNDYLTKPFSVEELLARLRVTQRRLALIQNVSNEQAVYQTVHFELTILWVVLIWVTMSCL